MKLTTIAGAFGAATLLAGGLSAQYSSTSIVNNYTDISTTGTSIGLAGIDDGGTPIPIGFGFDFYGTTISSINACTNGYLTTGTDLTDFTADCPAPSTNDPDGMMAPFFEDLSLLDHGEMYYETFGSPGSQLTIVQWDDVGTFDSSVASMNLQVHLFEGTTKIQFHYGDLADTSGIYPVLGDEAFIGLENDDGSAGEVITCNSGGPVLTPNVSAYEFEQAFPFISAPNEVISGELFNVPGQAAPATFYVFAWSLSSGPIGPIPLLEGITLDLGLVFKLAGAGLTPASGNIQSDTVLAPAGFDGTVVNWQAVTISSFGPIAGVSKSNPDTTTLRDGAVFTGSLDTAGVADHYTFNGTAGDVVTITHCRLPNLPDGTGTLDPYLCLEAPSGVVETLNDDGFGECTVDGPFAASIISGWSLLETGTYVIYASAYQGTPDGAEVGPYELTVIGSVATGTTLSVDEGALCPGQPFANPASKLLQNLEVKRRRR